MRPDDDTKGLEQDALEVGLQIIGTAKDHGIDVMVGYLFARFGRALKRNRPTDGSDEEQPTRARIYGPNGQVLRDVDLRGDPSPEADSD